MAWSYSALFFTRERVPHASRGQLLKALCHLGDIRVRFGYSWRVVLAESGGFGRKPSFPLLLQAAFGRAVGPLKCPRKRQERIVRCTLVHLRTYCSSIWILRQ